MGKIEVMGKVEVILRRKDGRGREIFGSVILDKTEKEDFVERTTEAGTFVKVLGE